MQLRTVCDKRLEVPIISGSFEAKISIDIQQTWYFLWLLRFLNVKSHVFLQSEKNVKYVFSNTVCVIVVVDYIT